MQFYESRRQKTDDLHSLYNEIVMDEMQRATP